ncbi:hypothetical protein Hamer_G029941 [Homarus americanus]|uniref:Uncharacterized protein n=1 Tax=Homarus americanus TaxID=6706 RepID=A0A8J5NFN3_HOMAM|nr:hypothetical protein Hamer_G027972 [Homarus americanus]KAG7163810.1 hypothetical protein Hamer_G028618 [Homarus americanus]KAG7177928.1 hypothetical protein Hamer_G029941 [Homarus americanus]
MMLMKKNEDRRRADDPGIMKFKSELSLTMKFYKNTVFKDMAAAKKGKTQAEQDAIDTDILFMKSMLSDRVATYSGVNKVLKEKVQERQKRQMREEKRQEREQCDHVENVQADIDSPISSDEDDDIDEASTAEPKRKHR